VKRLPGDRLQDISQILLDENAHFGVRFARSAAYAALALPGGRELDKSEFEALVYYLIMSDINTAEVKLPSSAPLSAAALAQMMNLPVAYTSRQEALESYSAQNRRMLFDAVYAVCRLAQHIAHTGASLEDIAAMISPPHIRVSEVACGWEDIGRVIRTVYETGRACASEGLRMDEQNGYGYICPHENSPKIVIRTEGHTEEFAEELCAKYTGMVKDILKK